MTVQTLQLPAGVPPLHSYYVYLTGGCNLACRHCWIAPSYQANGGTGGHLEYELLELAIKEGLPLGLKGVKLTGGEPLLHPEFVRIVDLLRENNLDLVVETNGTLLTADLAKYFKEKSTLRSISVSLDGASAEGHDAFRGVKGSFEKACQAIRYLVEQDIRPQVIMSLYKGNIDEIEALVTLAQELGATSVKFNIVQPSGRGEMLEKRGQTLAIEELIKIGRWMEGDLRNRFPSISLVYSWPMAFFGKQQLMHFSNYTCDVKNILGILSSGHLALCGIGTQEPELVYGSLGVDKLENVWYNHPRLEELRKDIPDNLQGICGECIFKERCLGVCVAENFHVYGTLTAPAWFCDLADKAELFPITRKRSIKNEQTQVSETIK